MLSIKNLTVFYGDTIALDDIFLQLEAKKLHGFIGLNGAGKTTLLNTLYGFLEQESGEILWNERELITTDIAYLPAESYFYQYITGQEYLELICLKNPDFDITLWNEMFNLPLDDLIESYSSGMKKKLAVMGVMAVNRSIIMLDEPFNNLDIATNHLLGTILKKLVEQGKTVLLTSHVLESMTSLCDHIHLIENGKMLQTFDKGDFMGIESYLFKKRDTLLDKNLRKLTEK